MDKYVVCAYRYWNIKMYHETIVKFNGEFNLISDPALLTLNVLDIISPKIIFFLDWSWKVPKEITQRYFCVNFHATDLPKFRGGSPIQNQIIRGVKKTKLSAFIMNEGLDTGDILLKEDLDLTGHLADIFARAGSLMYRMIQRIISGDYKKAKQASEASYFKRRSPSESELKPQDFSRNLEYLNDFIRMLEHPYPNAYIIISDKKLTFTGSEMKNGKVLIQGEISNA